MMQRDKDSRTAYVAICGIACLFVLSLYVWQGKAGLNLWDEGFLWYGAQRTLAGEIPKLDFKAYDPGRYYWCAAIMSLLADDGITALRTALAVFQALGLSVALILIAQTQKKTDFGFLAFAAVILLAWMIPRHKIFDEVISIFSIAALSFLIRRPCAARFLMAGVWAGIAAVFGRNHGLYFVLGFVIAMVWLHFGQQLPGRRFRLAAAFLLGLSIGYSPLMAMLQWVEGFREAFHENLAHQMNRSSTNLAIAVPWPWAADVARLSVLQAIREWLVGLFFVAIPLSAAVCAGWLALSVRRRDLPPLLVASVCFMFPYAHVAFSRADIAHLAQGIFPVLMAAMVLLSRVQRPAVKWLSVLLLLITSLCVVHVVHPGWQCRRADACVPVHVSGRVIQVDRSTAKDIALIRQLVSQYAKEGRSFVVAPFWPGAYALMSVRAPVWENFALWPQSPAFEQKEIARLKQAEPGFVLIYDLALDGKEERRFARTHPLTNRYVQENFYQVQHNENPAYHIYVAKDMKP